MLWLALIARAPDLDDMFSSKSHLYTSNHVLCELRVVVEYAEERAAIAALNLDPHTLKGFLLMTGFVLHENAEG